MLFMIGECNNRINTCEYTPWGVTNPNPNICEYTPWGIRVLTLTLTLIYMNIHHGGLLTLTLIYMNIHHGGLGS